ncbi:MAG TPA: VOC family protein [Candidatus Dormibacteraeota bacterium]|nr:VOC family protein [Candidatus Dormibacteraeota bacterium]
MNLLVFPAPDLAKSKALFRTLLGTDPYVDSSFYVGFRTNGLEIGLDPNGKSAGPIAYWEVDDIEGALKRLLDAGAEKVQDPHDVGRGLLVAQARDAGGSTIGLRSASLAKKR